MYYRMFLHDRDKWNNYKTTIVIDNKAIDSRECEIYKLNLTVS